MRFMETSYTKSELIIMAFKMAENQTKTWRDSSEDSESWDHYQHLLDAFEALKHEAENDGRIAAGYEMLPYEDMGHTFYLIRKTDDEKYFAGYDFMGSIEWADSPADGYEMGREEAEAILDDMIAMA